jgi:hypothetical protein
LFLARAQEQIGTDLTEQLFCKKNELMKKIKGKRGGANAPCLGRHTARTGKKKRKDLVVFAKLTDRGSNSV